MANVDQKNLIPLCILEVLRKYSDPDHPLTHNMIADHLEEDYGISPRPERKSIGRNLENLKTQMDIDMEITPKGSYLVSRDFEDYEIRLLIDLVLSNKYISVIETKELVEKLKSLSGVYFNSYEENLLTIDEKKKTDKRDLYLKLQLINDAIKSSRDIKFVLAEEAEEPRWMSAKDYLEIRSGVHDSSNGSDRKAQIKPEYLVLMNNRYYVAFKAILKKNIGGDLVEELTYCSLDEMHDLSIVDHEPVILPKGVFLLEKVEVSEEGVREMVSRDVIEQPGINGMRVDFQIDPPLLNKVKETFGEPVLVSDCTKDLFPQKRVIIDVDRNTFESFWLNHATQVKLLGPKTEIIWLKYLLNAARESISDAECFKELPGIDKAVLAPNVGKGVKTRKRSGKPCPEKKILNERIYSKEYETEAHFFGRGDVMMKCYDLRAELEIEDEGHVIFLSGKYDAERHRVYLWATTESLFSIKEENEDIYGELAARCNAISEAGIEKYYPGTDPADRYSDMESHMLRILRDRVKQDKRDDELSEDSISWEILYYNEDRTEPFDIDKLFADLELEDL